METSIMDDMENMKGLLDKVTILPDEIKDNINNAIQSGEQTSLAEQILELQEESGLIELELKAKKTELMNKMLDADIKTIKHKLAIFTVAERKNVKVDKEKCQTFLDSQGIYEEFSKIDETKVKKIYPTAGFISEGKPTQYLTIKEVK